MSKILYMRANKIHISRENVGENIKIAQNPEYLLSSRSSPLCNSNVNVFLRDPDFDLYSVIYYVTDFDDFRVFPWIVLKTVFYYPFSEYPDFHENRF